MLECLKTLGCQIGPDKLFRWQPGGTVVFLSLLCVFSFADDFLLAHALNPSSPKGIILRRRNYRKVQCLAKKANEYTLDEEKQMILCLGFSFLDKRFQALVHFQSSSKRVDLLLLWKLISVSQQTGLIHRRIASKWILN